MNPGKAKEYKVIVIALLVGITLFSVFKYLTTLNEKNDLLKNLNQVKGQIMSLELEKQNLLQTIDKEKESQKALTGENATLKDELKNLAQVDESLQNSQKTIEQLTSQIAISKAENTALREEKNRLSLKLTQVSQEKDALRARVSSVPELKKTIKEVKVQVQKAKAVMREIAHKRRVIEGNRGYLMKNGKPTFPVSKIKIEVMPASASK